MLPHALLEQRETVSSQSIDKGFSFHAPRR
jgi:hypothetical protein